MINKLLVCIIYVSRDNGKITLKEMSKLFSCELCGVCDICDTTEVMVFL